MKIGKLSLATGSPQADRLLASTGLSVGAMREQLGRRSLASTVAAALLACATGDKPPARSALASAIAEAGVDEVRMQVKRLYDAAAKGHADVA